MGDIVQAFVSYLRSIFHRSQSIDTDSPLARQTRWIGCVVVIVFIIVPGAFVVVMTYFPSWFGMGAK